MKKEIAIHICSSEEGYSIAKGIATNYMKWLGMDLTYQNPEKEMAFFEKMYGNPDGCYLYVTVDSRIAGGVGYRFLEQGICEMKRLFVYEDFKGLGIGKLLCERLLNEAKKKGYHTMRLDTVPRLAAANHLYKSLGFKNIPKYYNNPDPEVIYFEKEL